MSVIGIDLGTTNSCVAVCREGLINVIEDEQHERSVPSCVAFTPIERFVGFLAESDKKSNPTNTVYGIKRIIGRSYDYAHSLKNNEAWPFELENSEGKPKICIQYRGEWKSFYPEEISAMVLSHMKNIAATKTEVSGAVITVPASFDCAQRKATCDAAEIAGIKVLSLINETTAVALAYRLRNLKEFSARNVLVLHLGVGTFDVSVITIDDLKLTVKSTIGNLQIGGENFTGRLFNLFAETDIMNHLASTTNLHIACEKLKVSISDAETASTVTVINGQHMECKISRKDFNKATSDHLNSIMVTISEAIHEAQIDVSQVDDVLVTGGNAGMPMISEMLTKFGFDSKIRSVDIVEDAARGAAALAALISKEEGFRWKGLVLQEISSQSLVTHDLQIFNRGASIPQNKDILATCEIGRFCYDLFNEERVVNLQENRTNRSLQHRHICRISFIGSVDQVVSIRFMLDQSGLLEVIPQNQAFLQLETNIGLSIQQIKNAEAECGKFNDEDRKRKILTKALDKLEREALKVQKSMTDLATKCERIAEWACQNLDRSSEEIRGKQRELWNISSKAVRKRDAKTQTPVSKMEPAEGRRPQTSELELTTSREEEAASSFLNSLVNQIRSQLIQWGFMGNEQDQEITVEKAGQDQVFYDGIPPQTDNGQNRNDFLKMYFTGANKKIEQLQKTKLQLLNEIEMKEGEVQKGEEKLLDAKQQNEKNSTDLRCERKESRKWENLWIELGGSYKLLQEERGTLKTQHEQLEKEKKTLEKNIGRLQRTIDERDGDNKKLDESLQKSKDHHEQLYGELRRKCDTLEERNKMLENDNERQRKSIGKIEDDRGKLEDRLQQSKTHHDKLYGELQYKLDKLQGQNKTLEDDNELQCKRMHELEDDKKETERKLKEARKSKNKWDALVKQKQEELDESKKKFQELKDHHEKLYGKLQKKCDTLDERNKTLEKENQEMEKEMAEVQTMSRSRKVGSQERRLRKENEKLRKANQEQRTTIQNLKSALEKEKQGKSKIQLDYNAIAYIQNWNKELQTTIKETDKANKMETNRLKNEIRVLQMHIEQQKVRPKKQAFIKEQLIPQRQYDLRLKTTTLLPLPSKYDQIKNGQTGRSNNTECVWNPIGQSKRRTSSLSRGICVSDSTGEMESTSKDSRGRSQKPRELRSAENKRRSKSIAKITSETVRRTTDHNIQRRYSSDTTSKDGKRLDTATASQPVRSEASAREHPATPTCFSGIFPSRSNDGRKSSRKRTNT